MKTLKIKTAFFSLMAVLTLSVLMISCEQEPLGIIIEDLDGIRPAEVHDVNGTLESVDDGITTVKQADETFESIIIDEIDGIRPAEVHNPLGEMEAAELAKKAEAFGQDDLENKANCNCSNMGATQGFPNSSYIYCYGNNGQAKGFHLRKAGTRRIIETGYTTGYYVHCTNLQPGTTYQYRVVMNCPGGGQSASSWVSFTQ